MCGGRKASGRECVSGRQVSATDFESCSWAGRPFRHQVACPPALTHPRVAHLAWPPGCPRRISKEQPEGTTAGSVGVGSRGHSSDSLALASPPSERARSTICPLLKSYHYTTLSGQPLFAASTTTRLSSTQEQRGTLLVPLHLSLLEGYLPCRCREEHWTESLDVFTIARHSTRHPSSRPTQFPRCRAIWHC